MELDHPTHFTEAQAEAQRAVETLPMLGLWL